MAGNIERMGDLEVTQDFSQFTRYQSPSTLRVHLRSVSDADGQARLWLSRDFIDKVELRDVEPDPERIEAQPDCIIYTFNLLAPDQSTDVIFHFEPNGPSITQWLNLDEQDKRSLEGQWS